MVIMPSTPVIFSLSFGLKWKIVQNSAHMRSPLFNHMMQILLRIGTDSQPCIVIDLQSEETAHIQHEF